MSVGGCIYEDEGGDRVGARGDVKWWSDHGIRQIEAGGMSGRCTVGSETSDVCAMIMRLDWGRNGGRRELYIS